VLAGYGNLAPKTAEGKVVTMLYALVGVPLMLLCLSNLGALLAGTFQFAYSHARCYACTRNRQQQRRLPQADQGPQAANTYEKPKAVTELPKKAAPPVVPTVRISAVGRGPRVQNRPPPPRPLTPEVRKILTECAEYSLAEGSDPAAAKLLQELELGNVSAAADVDDDDDDDDDAEKEEEGDGDDDCDDDDDDLEDAEQEQRWYTKLSFIINTAVG
jgi:hypothetical protein